MNRKAEKLMFSLAAMSRILSKNEAMKSVDTAVNLMPLYPSLLTMVLQKAVTQPWLRKEILRRPD